MKSNLKNGRLPTPVSLPAALARLAEVTREAAGIEVQLGDPTRAARLRGTDFDGWRVRAKAAVAYLRKEAALLSLWIDQQPGVDLLAEARRALFDALAIADAVGDLESEEISALRQARAVLARLEAVGSAAATPRAAAVGEKR